MRWRHIILIAVAVVLVAVAGISRWNQRSGEAFRRTFGFELPHGLHLEHERRLIHSDGLFTHYFAELAIDDPDSFDKFCSKLGLKRSRSVRSIPFAAPKDVNWWPSLSYDEAMRNKNRFLWEGANNEMISVNVIGEKAYLMKIGDSVEH